MSTNPLNGTNQPRKAKGKASRIRLGLWLDVDLAALVFIVVVLEAHGARIGDYFGKDPDPAPAHRDCQ